MALLAWAPVAEAAFPGQNGKIAFDSAGVVETMNPDGSGRTALRPGFQPAWSPDGDQIAFAKAGGPPPGPCCRVGSSVYRMPADGSSETLVAEGGTVQWNHAYDWSDPAWSPDGGRLALTLTECETGDCWQTISRHPSLALITQFGRSAAWRPYSDELAYVRQQQLTSEGLWGVRSDGSANHVIWRAFSDPGFETYWAVENPDYSPQGDKIVFSSAYPTGASEEILLVPSTGGTPVALTNNSSQDVEPVWSPDGTKIAFISDRDGNREIYTMNADGTNQTRITNTPEGERNPSWQPLPYPGYARPKGATPVRVSLVPAYAACTAPNRTHGPPLAFGSCNPPAPESAELTVGDAPASMSGFVRYEAILGDVSTPEDEADLGLRVQITDVRERDTLADYAGEVQGQATTRMTDRTGSGGDPGTAIDVRFPLTTPCAPTPDPAVGSTCSLTTTLDTLIPGAVVERERTILQLGQVRVVDGGPDGDVLTEPNTVFLRQGVFVP